MPRMRIMSWVLFTLSLAFFFVQDFRWGLQIPYWEATTGLRWDLPAFSQESLLALAERARQSHDARSLAFVALQIGPDRDVAFADQAVAMDPSLTWIYYGVANRHRDDHGWKQPAFAATLKGWIAKLQAFDPQNAVPYLLEAEAIRDRTEKFPDLYPPFTPDKGDAVAKQAGWLAAMEKAFTSPQYDGYAARRFDLDRTVLKANGWARPDRMVLASATHPIPNLLNVRGYANYKVKYLALEAERAKHHDQAMRQLFQTALFGQRMQVEGSTLIEQLIGVSVDRIASEPLEAELKKAGQADQAELVAFSFRRFRRDHHEASHRDPLAVSSNQSWAILAAHISAFAVVFFAAATLLCALYLNAKRWIRVQTRGHIFQFVTGAVNYLAVLLFVSCLVLFLVCLPYFVNFRHYMDAPGEIRNLEPMFMNSYPFPDSEWQWGDPDPLLHPVQHYLRWAGLGLVLLALVGWIKKRMGGAAPAPAK
jgi:hypothetical protein